jgi:hypothetical protein
MHMTSQPGLAGNDAHSTPENDPVTAFPEAAPNETDVMLGVPVNLRSAALWVIAVIVSLAALRFASAMFIPLVVGVMLSYAMTPLVNQMVRLYIPRVLAAAILLIDRHCGRDRCDHLFAHR